MSLSKSDVSRRVVLGSLGAIAFTSIFDGCSTHFEPVAAAAETSTSAGTVAATQTSSAAVQASVTIQSTKIGTIGADFCGLSYEKTEMALPFFQAKNGNAIGLFRRLSTAGHLRIGGDSVDITLWAPNGKGQSPGHISPPDVDALAGFLSATGWKVLYGVNLATSTPALAAAEVAYVVEALGDKLAAIEIGNEPDGYTGKYFPSTWGPNSFIARWQQFADAILAKVPDVVFSGPAMGWLNHVPTWSTPFVTAVGKQVNQVTQHYYVGDGLSSASTMNLMLTPDQHLTNCIDALQVLSKSSKLPFRFTEANSFYNGGAAGVSNTGGSALWAADFLFRLAQGGATGANFHGGGSSRNSYSPIADSAGTILSAPPPMYYGLLLFSLAGPGSLLETSLSAGNVNASAYTIESASGGLNLVVINKDASQSLKLGINAGRKINKATAMLLTMPSLGSTSGLTIQESAVADNGSFSPQTATTLSVSGTDTSISVNAGSAALIQIT
jgi:hypothetical protein